MMRVAMKRLALLATFLVAACGPNEQRDPQKEPPAKPPPSNVEWLSHAVKSPAKMRGFVISTPKAWVPARIGNDWGLQFSPPGESWRRNFNVYWAKRAERLERLWADGQAKYLEGPNAGTELERGKSSVGGMPAHYLIFEGDFKPVGKMAWIVWFYVGPDGFGEIKAECRGEDLAKYRPLFDEMTRRIRYRSP